jgi:hypothetical protein
MVAFIVVVPYLADTSQLGETSFAGVGRDRRQQKLAADTLTDPGQILAEFLRSLYIDTQSRNASS